MDQLLGDWQLFLERMETQLAEAGISLSEFKELDHLAFRTDSYVKYEDTKTLFSQFGILVSENMVMGRPIAVFKLNEPLEYKDFRISAIEVPAPKEGNRYKNGLEHCEFVPKKSLELFYQDHKELNFEDDAMNRKNNPVLTLVFDNAAVKFHEKSLLEVVEIQKLTGEL